jgi:glycosyltransferase involved in cell wall biosynthesis
MRRVRLFEFLRPEWGEAFKRISQALRAYAPDWVQWVNDASAADVALVHVVGPGEVEVLERMTIPHVIFQQCYYTASADVVDYPQYWARSLLTASFHDLPKYTDRAFPYYGMPWGADQYVFHPLRRARTEKVLATGHVAETEAIDKLFEAARRTGTVMHHTGQDFGWDGNHYRHHQWLSDKELAWLLNSVEYVSAMRFTEGFELMAIEGLFCGARPLIPAGCDTYNWYREHAIVVETTGDLVGNLATALATPPTPVSRDEYAVLVEKFAWENILARFFGRVREAI